MVEGVRIGRWRRGFTLAESRKIRRYQMAPCGEQRDQRIEFSRRRRKSVQQHDCRRVLRPRFAIEDPDAVDRRALIGGGQRTYFNYQFFFFFFNFPYVLKLDCIVHVYRISEASMMLQFLLKTIHAVELDTAPFTCPIAMSDKRGFPSLEKAT